MRGLTRLAVVVMMVAACVLLTGCRSDMWPFGTGPALSEGYSVNRGLPPAYDSDRDVTGSWQSLDAPLPDGPGTLVPIQDRRWEGLVVYFAYDRSTVGAAERPKLEMLANFLKEQPTYSLVVEGHADERGSDEYNRALSERRALAVREYLVSLGVAESRIDTVGYGEERPAVPGSTAEKDHALNRRAEFVVGIRK